MRVFNLAASEPWMLKAKCRDADDPEAWDTNNLPRSTPNQPHRHKDHAKALCQGCPVMRDCAQFAIDNNCTGMVFAGIPLRGDDRKNASNFQLLRNIILRCDRRKAPWHVK